MVVVRANVTRPKPIRSCRRLGLAGDVTLAAAKRTVLFLFVASSAPRLLNFVLGNDWRFAIPGPFGWFGGGGLAGRDRIASWKSHVDGLVDLLFRFLFLGCAQCRPLRSCGGLTSPGAMMAARQPPHVNGLGLSLLD